MLFLTAKIANACILENDPLGVTFAKINFWSEIYFYSSIIFLLAVIVIYFLKKRKAFWIVLSGLVSLILVFALATLDGSCGFLLYKLLRIEFVFTFLLFMYQLLCWILETKNDKCLTN